MTVIDKYTHECRAIDVAGSIRSKRVIEVLSRLVANKAVNVFPSSEITKIVPAAYLSHRCKSPQSCFGVPHDVTVQLAIGASQVLSDIGLIVIRHGTHPIPLLAGAAVKEQMTPIDVPA